jgi:polyisoprenoid-binding protein YceI
MALTPRLAPDCNLRRPRRSHEEERTMTITKTALDGVYELDRTHSTLQFAVEHAGVSTFRASIGELEAHLFIDDGAARLEAGSPVESISIGDPPEFREHVIRGDDFFSADAHPRMRFASTQIEVGPDDTLAIHGVLEIRGVERHVSGVGTLTPPTDDPFGNTRIGIALEATVDRRSWGMDWQMQLPAGGNALGWDVQITAHLEFTKRL